MKNPGVLSFRWFSLFQPWVLPFALVTANAVHGQQNVEKTGRGLGIQLGQTQVELTVTASDAFRLRIARDSEPRTTPSSFLADTNCASSSSWKAIKDRGLVGIQSKVGRLLMDPRNGDWSLQNSKGKVLIPLHAIAEVNQEGSINHSRISMTFSLDKIDPVSFYGSGNGVKSLQHSKATSGVSNGKAVVPYYWSTAGYAALAVTANDNRPASWLADTEGGFLTWTFPGPVAELYLMPADSPKAAAESFAKLAGRPPVPPRWAFGYLQSCWGWKNRAFIEDTLKQFRELKIPVDAFIYDFEWYATKPDYELPANGESDFTDFGWNTNMGL